MREDTRKELPPASHDPIISIVGSLNERVTGRAQHKNRFHLRRNEAKLVRAQSRDMTSIKGQFVSARRSLDFSTGKPKVFCHMCGEKYVEEAMFCTYCGIRKV